MPRNHRSVRILAALALIATLAAPAWAGDSAPPTAMITAPADGTPVSGEFRITAGATDDVALRELKIWGARQTLVTQSCSGKACTASVTIDLSSGPPGAWELNAEAVDASGRRTISATVTVFTGPPLLIVPSGAFGYEEPFGVGFRDFRTGRTFRGPVAPVRFRSFGGAYQERGPIERRFVTYIDGIAVSDVTTTVPYNHQEGGYNWNLMTYADGVYLLGVTATDERGRTVPAITTYGVLNTPSGYGEPGGASLLAKLMTSPPPTDIWSGIVAAGVRADRASLGADATLTLALNGVEIGRETQVDCEDGSCMWSWLLDTTALPDGVYILTGIVVGSTGGTASHTIAVYVVNE